MTTLPEWYVCYCICIEAVAATNYPHLAHRFTGCAQGIVSGAVFAGEIDLAQSGVLHKAAESVCEYRLQVLQSEA